MSDQIHNEYVRVLDNYRNCLERALRSIPDEIANIDDALKKGYRLHVRHSLLDLADTIRDTEAKMKVFENFIWEPNNALHS